LKCLFSHFSEVFTSSNKVMLKKYGKHPISKISKISDIFKLENVRYISDICHRYVSPIYIVPTLVIVAVVVVIVVVAVAVVVVVVVDVVVAVVTRRSRHKPSPLLFISGSGSRSQPTSNGFFTLVMLPE